MRLPNPLRSRGPDPVVRGLLDEAGANACRAAELLVELLREWPESDGLAEAMVDCEHEGDRLTHDLIHHLRAGDCGALPFDTADGHDLARALDDIVDHAEQAADQLALYAVEAPMEQALALADVLVLATAQVAVALGALGDGRAYADELVEVHRLENEGDRLSREALAALFAGGIDPMVVIRWKDVYASLEAAVDACEHVAHVLEGIDLRRAR